MNWLDAQLTILWVRLNVATEGNGIMARLLNLGEAPFLGAKLLIGAFAAYLLFRCSHLPVARRGMKLVLAIYCALMFVHAATGLSALSSSASGTVFAYFVGLPQTVIGFFS
jgi:hypothetical protein